MTGFEMMLFLERLLVVLSLFVAVSESESERDGEASSSLSSCGWMPTPDVVLIKVGGSSITDKAHKETLNRTALGWFARSIAMQLEEAYLAPLSDDEVRGSRAGVVEDDKASNKSAFIILHGAGSFGHHTAKQYGLKGQSCPPPHASVDGTVNRSRLQYHMHGLAQTRLSVQKLNRHVVSTFVQQGVNAVTISPCFGVPSMQAHGGDDQTADQLQSLLLSTIQAGLVPILHGDACLYGTHEAGILSGDTLMEMIGKAPWITRAIFLTDVDGVFTSDPRTNKGAELLRAIQVDAHSGELIAMNLDATGSSHEHDVTGGLKTKLAAAASIAASGTNVTIARCGSTSAEQTIWGQEDIDKATILFGHSIHMYH